MRKLVIRVLLPLVVALPGAACARVAQLQIERLQAPSFDARNLHVTLDWPDAASTGTLRLRADRLDLIDTGISWRKFGWDCAATYTPQGTLACDGELRGTGIPASRLRASWADGVADLRLVQGKTGVDISGPGDASAWRVKATRVPAAWLKPLLAQLWPEGSITSGSIGGDWTVSTTSADTTVLGGALTLKGIGVDSSDGRIAAASLDAAGTLDLRLGAGATRVQGALTLRGGELLFGSVYASLPESPITLEWLLTGADRKPWAVERMAWKDTGVLNIDGSASIDPSAAASLQHLQLKIDSADLAKAVPRYFESLLGEIGLAGLQARGALDGQLALQAGNLEQLALNFDRVHLTDGAQRFAIDGLGGTFALGAAATPVNSALTWAGASVHGIVFGAARFALRSRQRGIALTQPVTIPALGGNVALPRFAWTPSPDAGAALDLALGLRNIDLRQLSRAFAWPEFNGTLSGDIPGVRYAGDVLDLQGGLTARVFDGNLSIDKLTLERPFGVAPTMTAAIDFSNFDLKPLTGAFGFGEITGRLDGYVHGLRLVDWTPVAFDAKFETSTKAKDPRRISQRAVRDLTEVGGGGIAAGLQAQVLKVFQTFGYSRIGLSCTLANDVCRMGGLDAQSGGYTIVDGSGLPRVTVIGHQRQVDWPVLVARLKAATEGQVPIID